MPIQTARLDLAPIELVEKLNLIEDFDTSSSILSRDFMTKTNTDALKALTDVVATGAARSSERLALQREIDRHILRDLRSGSLRCYGFELPRKMASVPVEVLPEHWTVSPDWDKGELRANGLHIVELRVGPGDAVPLSECLPQLSQPGRPTIKEGVEEAFKKLNEDKLIDTGTSVKAHIPLIKAYLSNEGYLSKAEAQNLSYEGIRKYFSPLFKELDKNRKQ